jgi:hypothetical protein
MLRYAVDELNSDRVVGWVFEPGTSPTVTVVVNGSPVGHAQMGGYRVDVAQALGDENARCSGFEFQFRPEHFGAESRSVASIGLLVNDEHVVPVAVPVLSRRRPTPMRGPFPPEVLSLLASYSSKYDQPELWDESLSRAAVDDLSFLLERGPRAMPALHGYLSLLAQLSVRASFVERYFPRENTAVSLDAKDRSGIQNSGLEVFAIAAHLVTLCAHGLDGPFLEFGCFKGFSTAILSDACHQLDVTMHVFDSFRGLPPSESSYYHEGDFAGGLNEVRANVRAYGRLSAVVFHEGFFSETIPGFGDPTVMSIWMDVDLASSSEDVASILPRLDRRGVFFSHECPPEIFQGDSFRVERTPEQVVPAILDSFAGAGRRVVGRHIAGNTGAFWDGDCGVAPLDTSALLSLRDLALSRSLLGS